MGMDPPKIHGARAVTPGPEGGIGDPLTQEKERVKTNKRRLGLVGSAVQNAEMTMRLYAGITLAEHPGIGTTKAIGSSTTRHNRTMLMLQVVPQLSRSKI